jgi:alkanesulfonate monooxygenase SsuD/methylene tetrahydromethanopterin reductase-like flavin-dependent oxidoreductase (luciferase family)
VTLAPHAQKVAAGAAHRAVVGAPADAADQIRALAEEFEVDEVMINPVASAHRGTHPATAPARVKTLELLAKELF